MLKVVVTGLLLEEMAVPEAVAIVAMEEAMAQMELVLLVVLGKALQQGNLARVQEQYMQKAEMEARFQVKQARLVGKTPEMVEKVADIVINLEALVALESLS